MILRHVSEASTKSLRLSLVTMIPSVFSARWSRNLGGGQRWAGQTGPEPAGLLEPSCHQQTRCLRSEGSTSLDFLFCWLGSLERFWKPQWKHESALL